MRRQFTAGLMTLAISTAAWATPMPRASSTPGVGSDNWAECRVSAMGLMHAPYVWRVSWHECYPMY